MDWYGLGDGLGWTGMNGMDRDGLGWIGILIEIRIGIGSGWSTCLGLKLGLRSGLGVGLGVGLELVWGFGIWIEIGIEKGIGIWIGLGLGISISQVRGSGCFDKPSPRIRRCWTSHFGGSVILNKPDSFGESMFADPEFLISQVRGILCSISQVRRS